MINEKSLSIITFTVFGFLIYPLAIAFHQHFFADGAFFFAQLVEHGKIAVAGHNPSRYITHLITQSPVVLALKIGITDPSLLSRIYGVCLYYSPFLCYLLSAWLLFRKGMMLQVLLLLLALVSLSNFSWLIIVSESHLAAALFILTLSVIMTCHLNRLSTLLALLLLALTGLSCYEFWAFYYLMCLVFFIWKIRGKSAPLQQKILQILIMILFLGGIAANASSIIFSKYSENRDAMISSQLRAVWPAVVAVSLFFGSTMLSIYYSGRVQTWTQLRNNRLSGMMLLIKWCNSRKFIFAAYSFGVLVCASYIMNLHKVNYAYNLRILNIILPVMFGLSFLLPDQSGPQSIRKRGPACLILMAVALMAAAHIYQTSQWGVFKKSFTRALEVNSGYIPMQYTEILNRKFLWSWTSPSMSILFQALESMPVQTILFNPRKQWEPYGPSPVPECNPETLAERLGVPLLL